MSVTNLDSQQEYENYVKSQDLSVVHFYTPWADQCSQINDVIEEMSKLAEYKGVKFAKLEAEKMPDLSLKVGISAVPTVILIRNDTILDRIDGADPSAIAQKIKRHLSNNDISIDACKPKEKLEERLKKLINQASYSYKADYQTFDILQDNDVREGLKKFSDWPTYPQLYINGELIGGLDIVKELVDSGELENMLPKKS
ncbi:hypothetical protein QLX08_011300 [Tetragonisca angustula]|uniref:Thioredoxin domain-containing protein n=1 Tax=Tetragonisca angustula TaxID=166442 RepID=A0AAW0Z8S8_9HYME